MTSPDALRLRLYIAGDSPNSLQAMSNLAEICRVHLPGHHHVEIVDVMRDPQRALSDGVYLTPTLVKFAPEPARRIVGTLSDPTPVLSALGLDRR